MSRAADDARRGPRHAAAAGVPVVDTMSNRALGFLRNLSAGGLQLVASSALVDQALYQVLFELEDDDSGRVTIEAGVQAVNQRMEGDDVVVGMRFVHVDGENSRRLGQWLAAHEAGTR